ncbi:MAG TPA: aspartate aminotransferase family protein [Phycisphaerales bacterium]|nr:aspartate aminotransferase family protein [Phycisphaerales bacterium]
MTFDITQLIRENTGRNYDLHREHINPQYAKVLKTIGFDRVHVRAQGPYLWDNQGRQYLDFIGGYAVTNVGRTHPTVKKALMDFLAGDHPSMIHFEAPLLSGLLAEELKKRIGRGLDYVFFTNSGTEGVECAIKYAKCATGKPAMVFCEKAFHGLSTGSLSLNGCESFRKGFAPFLPESRQIPFNDLSALEAQLKRGDVAGFIVEPVQGKGVNLPAPGYLAKASALCGKYGALFIVDEIQSGVGRCGTFLAIDAEEGFENDRGGNDGGPDIVILSKALSGGYVPVGAVLTHKAVYEKVYSSMERAIVHSSTFHQNSMAMVAGLASLAALDEDDMIANGNRMGAKLREGIEGMMDRFALIKEVRQRGMMIGIEFGPPSLLKSPALRTAWSMIHTVDGNLFTQAVVIPLMEDHLILTQVAGHNMDVLKLTPPLMISEADVKRFLSAFEDVMVKLHKFPGPTWELMTRLGRNAFSKSKHSEAVMEAATS